MAFSEVYVDPSIAADSGTGTIGDPFGDLEYAIEQSTFDTTNGTRVNNSNVTVAALQEGDTLAFGRVCYKFVRLDTVGSSRTLDLGADRTLILAPHGRPGGASAAASPVTSSRRPASGQASGRHRTPAPSAGSGLGLWVTVVGATLALVLGAIVLLD